MESPVMVFEMKKKPYLGTFGIIKSAIKIPLSSYTFLFITFLTSLPLSCARLIPKLPDLSVLPSFLQTPFLATQKLSLSAGSYDTKPPPVPDSIFLILNTLLIDILRFVVAITTVHSASKLHQAANTGTRSLIRPISTTTLVRPISTFFLASFFSSVSVEAATYWGGHGPLVRSRTIFFHVVHGITFAAAMAVWSGFCAFWNMGVVLSVLEGKRGLGAFSASGDLMKGNMTRGTILMVIDTAWRISLVLPGFFLRWDFFGGVGYKVAQEWLFSTATVLNWVVLVVYYYDCKNRQRESKNMVLVKDEPSDQV
ncbi:Transmembrane protein [Parasponia andersonii]|uniref:Transmembrane protein n=1 Tax=Parasponia andersonii TaxID=3476 RepID=A0A2P5CE25_PARAD|nr:Transmembrane protein [Parasponia andersonii]